MTGNHIISITVDDIILKNDMGAIPRLAGIIQSFMFQPVF